MSLFKRNFVVIILYYFRTITFLPLISLVLKRMNCIHNCTVYVILLFQDEIKLKTILFFITTLNIALQFIIIIKLF